MSPATDKPRHRSIRSYVRRTGRLTPSQQRALATLWPVYGIEPGKGLLVPASVFGRDAPVVLEIGFGNGDTLVEMAALDPDSDFIGVEVHARSVFLQGVLLQARQPPILGHAVPHRYVSLL